LQAQTWWQGLEPSAEDRINRFVFDSCGREIYRLSPEGHVLERGYDSLGNIKLEITHNLRYEGPCSLETIKSVLSKDNNPAKTTAFNYDTAGRLSQKKEADIQSTAYAYDENGNLVDKTEANGAHWTYAFDAANQLIEIRSPIVAVKSEQ